jgi:NADH-quinone oxidoreductase subunit H
VEFVSQLIARIVSGHPVVVVSLVKIALTLFVVMTALAYLTWFERKVVARMQSRWGPYYVGAHGLLQPLADGVKFLFKEDLTPPSADIVAYILAPFLALVLALTAIALLPIGPTDILWLGQPIFAVSSINVGLIFLFAITSLGVYGVALAGWSSNSKYPLMGGLRSSAQMISYEVSLTLSVVGVILMAGTLDLSRIVSDPMYGQTGYWLHFIPKWNVFPQIIGFLCYITAAIAETNRVPFDLPEAETELVAGFHTEYSSFKFAMFFMAEYANMITVSCLATILFFGGWLSPFGGGAWEKYIPVALFLALAIYCLVNVATELQAILHKVQFMLVVGIFLALAAVCFFLPVYAMPPFWFILKIAIFMFFYVWARGTLPRFRYDQLMSFGWKLLLPVSLANLVVTAAVWLVMHP